MKFTQKMTVVGAQASKGELDNGQKYDFTKVFCLIDLDNSRGNAVGQGLAEYKWGDSKNFDLIQAQKLPLDVNAEFEMVAIKAGSKINLLNITLAK